MKSVYKSVVGMKRKNNEDSVFCGNDIFSDLFIVADGMGGCNGGEVASSEAIKAFVKELNNNIKEYKDDENILDSLISAIQYSNKFVYNKSCENPNLIGMGTTIDGTVIRKGKLFGVHVGDSRIYILRDNKLYRLTSDHSYVMELVKLGQITMEEAETHPARNLITNALGTKDNLEVDTVIVDTQYDDIILLCTDGLTTMINDKRIEEILNLDKSIEEKADILVKEANDAGGLDNITLILIEQEVDE